MKSINVIVAIGDPVLLAPEKGDVLRSEIIGLIESGSSVVVDFSGYQFLSSSFLNRAFGQLCLDRGWMRDDFRQHVEIIGLAADDADELELALYNAEHRVTLKRDGVDPEEFYATNLPVW